MKKRRKVIVIGLDCAAPDYVFEKWIDQLPHIRGLIKKGTYGRLRSSDPPITVPAWASMVTGKDPGQLGFYGFRNRSGYGYEEAALADSSFLKAPTVWDLLGKKGFRSIVMGVPPSYPPKPIRGHLVSCFLTPGRNVPHTYPSSLAEELKREVGEYMFDVEGFRNRPVEALLTDIHQMTRTRFQAARYLLRTKPWEFFMLVEMGTDRIQHACWHYMDDEHVLYQDSPHRDAILDYYRLVDQEIGRLLHAVNEEATVFLLSDHGAKRMDGGFCINEWLIQNGWLTLKETPEQPGPLRLSQVDWKQTRAWGAGGYYGRIFLNVKGREPEGTIPQHQYEATRDELIRQLERLTDESGAPLPTQAWKPEQRYRQVRGIPPDLFVYFGNLYWRSVGSVGLNTLYVKENDTGPDGANHDLDGIFVAAPHGGGNWGRGCLKGMQLMDVAPTLLREFGLRPAPRIRGRLIRIRRRKVTTRRRRRHS